MYVWLYLYIPFQKSNESMAFSPLFFPPFPSSSSILEIAVEGI
jgi:hypothetical protein